MLLLVVNAAAVAAEVACVSSERLTADLLRRMIAARI
jgi:hypothetical protein